MTSGIKNAVREALLWSTAIAATALGYLYFDEIAALTGSNPIQNHNQQKIVSAQNEPDATFERTVHLQASRNGNFYAEASINGRPIEVIVDTGATLIALSHEHADEIGIRPSASDYTYRARTANGIARLAPVTLKEVRINDISVKNVKAVVAQPGAQSITLLGMSFLSALKSVDLRGNELVLTD